MLEELHLPRNHIGNVGSLLDNPNCSIRTLSLGGNNIGNEGAITIANGLANNTTLQKLVLRRNPIESRVVEDFFCKVLCNTSSIIAMYIPPIIHSKVWIYHDIGMVIYSYLY